jgi:hypothetical protein
MKRIIIFCIISIVTLQALQAQQVTVRSSIDSSMMWIGNQTWLRFEVSQPKGANVQMPLFSDTIKGGLDIVELAKNDTSISADGVTIVSQKYLVTAFEDSLLYIPPFPFVVNDDTIWSQALSLKVVQPFVIDTTNIQLADIKGVYNPKIYWKGFLKVAAIILLILALLALTFIVVRKYILKRPVFGPPAPKVVLPAYVTALTKLEQIKQEKMWQQGRVKEFHTELTDVIREYIEGNFELNAPEMTSEEILEHFHYLRFEDKTAHASLQQLLQLADLVKFAKWTAMPDENEMSLLNAYLFVNQTKIEPIVEEPEETTDENDDSEEKRR